MKLTITNAEVKKGLIALLTPVFSAAAGLLVGAGAKYGIHLDPTGVTVLAGTGAVGAAGLGLKLVNDVEKDVRPLTLSGPIHDAITEVEHLANGAEKIDPNLSVAATQAEQKIAATVEQEEQKLVDAWPADAPITAPALAAPVVTTPGVPV